MVRKLRPTVQFFFSSAIAAGVFATVANAQPREVAMTCTNPASGARWGIRIDYDRSMVDSNPAHIDETQITWRDAKDGSNYSLDRKSGELTAVAASSTGGYFLHDICKLNKPR